MTNLLAIFLGDVGKGSIHTLGSRLDLVQIEAIGKGIVGLGQNGGHETERQEDLSADHLGQAGLDMMMADSSRNRK